MSTTETTTDLQTIAAAGLGRKATSMAITTDSGITRATATNGSVWVDVVAAVGDQPGQRGESIWHPASAGVNADVQFRGVGLRQIIDGIVPATDTESSRYALGGTLVEIAEGGMLNVVGTDGKRLHAGFIQPHSICGQASPIIAAEQWKALYAAIRATVRKLGGLSGKKLDAAIDAGTMRIMVGSHAATAGEVVSIYWAGAAGEVSATALAVAGRFPRWRDCIPSGGETLAANVAAVAGAVADYDKLHRAAVKAGKAAWKAEQEERKRRRQYSGGEYRHPRGIDCHRAGMVGHGAEWSSVVPASPVPVKLDHTYMSDALAGAAAWGATVADIAATDKQSAVLLTTGEFGPRFTAVIMPLAAD